MGKGTGTLAASVGLFALGVWPTSVQQKGAVEIILLGNRLGHAEGCGCSGEKDKPTLAKEASIISRIRRKAAAAGNPVLILDMGRNRTGAPNDYLFAKYLGHIHANLDRESARDPKAPELEYRGTLQLPAQALDWSLTTKTTDVEGGKSAHHEIKLQCSKATGPTWKHAFSFDHLFGVDAGKLIVGGKIYSAPSADQIVVVHLKVDDKDMSAELEEILTKSGSELDSDVEEMLRAHRQAEQDQLLTKLVGIRAKAEETASPEFCGSCHYESFRTWKESKHAAAYETLKAKNNLTDECLKCHSTVYVSTRSLPSTLPAQNLSVTCTNCHDSGQTHRKNPTAPYRESAQSSTCLPCHTKENSPAFNFEAYRKKVHAPH